MNLEEKSLTLELEALAERGEYVSLAALVHHADMEDALGALAASVQDAEAMRWVIVLLVRVLPEESQPQDQAKHEAYIQQLDQNLPENLHVPEDLREVLEDFVLTTPPTTQQSETRGKAQARILRNLDAKNSFALDLAESVLSGDGRYEGVPDAAFAVLGRSREYERRSVIFEHTENLPDTDRLAPLTELSAPLYKVEEDRLVELLDEVLPSIAVGNDPQVSESLRAQVRHLAGKLTAERLEETLRRQVESNSFQQLLSGDSFVAHLWPEKLKHLLSADLPQAVTEHLVIQAASQMPLDPLLELGRWAYGKIEAGLLSPMLRQVSINAQNQHSPEARSKSVRALADFAVRTDDSTVAHTLAVSISHGELIDLPQRLVSSATRARRLGRACASVLSEDEDFSEDVVGWMERLTEDAQRQALLAGIDDQIQELELDVDLDPLGTCVLSYPRAAKILCGMDGGSAALKAAEKSEDRRALILWVVEAAIEELDDSALETAAEYCTWSALSDEQYNRLVVAYARRPEMLLDEAARALTSLDLPEAEAIPPRLLQELLGAVLSHPVEELTRRLNHEPTHYLQQILDLRGRALHQRALEFAGRLSPDETLVDLLVSKRDTMQGLGEPFRGVLRAYAEELVAESSNTSLEAGPRVQALTLAFRAEPVVARQVAFDLCKANSAQIRSAAAEVLATTSSAPEDESRLRGLIEDESDDLTYSKLQAALRNVSSGNVDEAIRNLWQLVDSTPDGTCTAEVLLPDGWRHETFVKCVDIARARSGGEPTGYINSLITLSELIVETALIARYDATGDPSQPLRSNEVDLIRANDPAKPDAGDLVNRQQLLQKGFRWFHQVASMRDLRSVHPERAVSTNPQPVTQASVPLANGLFRAVLSGWRNSMLETRRLT